MEPSDTAGAAERSPRAERILQIDDEIAALERISSNPLRYGVNLIALLLVLVAVVVVASSGWEVAWLFLIRLFSIIVGVPAVIYAALLTSNRRQRRRLERELDKLIEDGDDADS
jgi:Flp pilus assembly protein TadB